METSSPQIAVIVVNWNGWRDTIAAYQSLRTSNLQTWRLLVVDNASSDESCARLADLGPQARLILNERNAGFAGGCNVGIQAALEEGADYVFLLNNDAIVREDTLARLAAASAEASDAILGCVVRFKGSGELQFFGSRTSAATGAPDWFKDPADLAQLDRPLVETDFVFGAALFAPTSLFRRVGLLDERFFLTFEETDWCYRARAAGSLCYVVRDALVEHAGSASLGSRRSPLQAYFLQRNRLLFCEMHGDRRALLRCLKSAFTMIRSGIARETLDIARGQGIDPTRQAHMLAVRDYLMRRFGDCPARVRRLMGTRAASA